MRWTVIWNRKVRRDLAEIWMNSSDRNAIRSAADSIDLELAVDADKKGEDFYGDRLLVIAPLAVVFTINRHDRLATVLEVQSQPRQD